MLTPVLRTKIIPPPQNANTLSRPRLRDTLRESFDHRLTLLQAGAGYGKSTALADFAQASQGVVWYQVLPEDNDPLVFLLHLNHAIRIAFPDLPDLPLDQLENWDGTRGPLPWKTIVDQILNTFSGHPESPGLFIIDDSHLVTMAGEIPHLLDRLIGRAPAHLHTLLSGRPTLSLPSLTHWRARGEVLIIEQSALAFTGQEISDLFAGHYLLELSAAEIQTLLRYTEGWAIALQLIWQNIRRQPDWEFPLHPQDSSLESLFDILTREVLEQQPEDVQEFLLITASLRELDPPACDALRGARDSAAMLAYLQRQDLFITQSGGGILRYHPIFHDFLRQQASPEQRQAWRQSAAAYFLKQNNPEAALYHLLEAGEWNQMADVLDFYADTLLSAGRLDTLDAYLASLPPETLHQHPLLLFTLGELARLHSRFDEARGWYEQAENIWRVRNQPDGVARALRGQARVYLDTVNPSAAERLLEEALRLSDGSKDREAQARLYELLSENKLNAGHVDEAERLRKHAEELRLEGQDNETFLLRVLLRTGQLQEARQSLEKHAQTEQRNPIQTPRAHRETLLILSLVYSLMGLGEQALQAAQQGEKRGQQLKSPFVTAVGFMRQGHALGLLGSDDAQQAFRKTIEISRSLSVPRLRVESNWGLCRYYGYRGDLSRAQNVAQEAIEIASQAGDEWIASLTRLTMGASLALARRYEAAEEWLTRAARGFEECSDPFGRSVSRIWLSFGLFQQQKNARLLPILPETLAEISAKGYDFFLARPSLLGPPDARIFFPMLLYAREQGWQAAYLQNLFEGIGLPNLALHPGFQLRVQSLGGFQVWRGAQPISANAWRREKARQLFQLLITFRKAPLNRDQLCEYLWPEADPQTAQRNFKVTLNALYQVLEPERNPGKESAFISRDENLYFLRPGADLWLDVDEFSDTLRLASPDPQILQRSLALYQGEYLPGAIYETWPAEERERLASLFLENADKLAGVLIEKKQYPEAIVVCQKILEQDNCWERAYRSLMLAYAALGDRGQVARIYQRCLQTLRDELDVGPSPETEKLYRTLTV
ncbi:MAG: BTAD domain-containing putative transcriptional regulator [Anaerolineales bacterium]|jgi:ATP/maltotriose-dependent transcriptional regulator MalT/DNA-binding SARP family transcriptional activator|nr:BTAD domain-containing putative transcriptional regulator [Anaerolineales bacterium]